MRYEQTRNILQHLAPNYHRTVSHYYQEFAEEEGISPRVKLMLDYLIAHEQHRALALGEFSREASRHVLDHWFRGLEREFPVAQPGLLDDSACNDLDQLVKVAVAYKNELIGYFNHLLEHASGRESVHLFTTLKTQEEKAMKRMIRHAQGLADL